MTRPPHLHTGREEGIAVLIAVILLLLISALAVTALQHSAQESTGGGRARHQTRNLYAAEGLLEVVVQQLTNASPVNKQVGLTYNNFIQDPHSGTFTTVLTGLPEAGVQQDIVKHGTGRARDGDQINGAIRYFSYSVNVTATDFNNTSGGRVGLEAQYAVLDPSGGGSYR
ncbi:MAG: hypothetical protein ACE5FG_03985 [Myxococcota bacterium]